MYCIRWRTSDGSPVQGPVVGLGEAGGPGKEKASGWLDEEWFGTKMSGAQRDILPRTSAHQSDLSRCVGKKGGKTTTRKHRKKLAQWGRKGGVARRAELELAKPATSTAPDACYVPTLTVSPHWGKQEEIPGYCLSLYGRSLGTALLLSFSSTSKPVALWSLKLLCSR